MTAKSAVRDMRRSVSSVFFRGLARAGDASPKIREIKPTVRVINNVPYRVTSSWAHQLDVFIPEDRTGPLPVLLYIHGGGFTVCSKDTHRHFAMVYASRGYLVFNINYRLAPKYRFPAAHEDACAAYEWVVRNARQYGGDPERLIVAGESAGANLATTLAIGATFRRPQACLRAVWETGIVPQAVQSIYGYLQVSNPARYAGIPHRPSRWWDYQAARAADLSRTYLGELHEQADEASLLADPLRLLEQHAPDRALPPFFVAVGTADLLLNDSQRLALAVSRHGAPVSEHYYPGEQHGFHAFFWRPAVRQFWHDCLGFLDTHAPPQLVPEPVQLAA